MSETELRRVERELYQEFPYEGRQSAGWLTAEDKKDFLEFEAERAPATDAT